MSLWLDLSGADWAWLAAICFLAGLVRGFSGFALSAVVMATAVLILPPVALIPICWVLEMTASLLMVRGGWQDADRRVVAGLVIGSACGVPLGLWATTTLPVETSKIVALCVIIALAVALFAKLRIPALASRAGLYLSGLVAGIVTGLAHVGGMVVALYVLAQETPAARMRAALVLFLFFGGITSLVVQLLFGVMDGLAFTRGLALAVPTALGVIAGKMLFTPRLAPYYRPFCLALVAALASLGLVRVALA